MMKTVLCYGDSNTWGFIPGTGKRFSIGQRWPGILQKSLRKKFLIIEAGLNGRTTVFDDPFKTGRNGLASLRPTLDSHSPVDLVILMLGTNDLKDHLGVHAADAARGVARLVETISSSAAGPAGGAPQILLVSPPEIGPYSASLSLQFQGALEKSREFSRLFAEIAENKGCHFLEAAQFVSPSPVDGVHLDEGGHARLAKAIAKTLVDMVK